MSDEFVIKSVDNINKAWAYISKSQRERGLGEKMMTSLSCQAGAADSFREAFVRACAGVLSLAALYPEGELTVVPFITSEYDGTGNRYEFKISRGGTWVGTVGWTGPSGTLRSNDQAKQVGAVVSAGVTMVIAPFPDNTLSGKPPVL